MRQVRYKETTAVTKTEHERERRDDAPVLDDEAVLIHLEAYCETDIELEDDGDPINGVAIAVIFGAVFWIALVTTLIRF